MRAWSCFTSNSGIWTSRSTRARRPVLGRLQRPWAMERAITGPTGSAEDHVAGDPGVATPYTPRYIDIGINLADPIFRGRYHGSQKHPDDLNGVVQRAVEVGCTKLIVTGSSFKSTRDALKLAQEFPGHVHATAGIHPCSSSIFSTSHHKHHDESESEGDHTPACDSDPSKPVVEEAVDHARSELIISDLRKLISDARTAISPGSPRALVALGEFGLDYDRLFYCGREVQLHSFAVQLDLAVSLSPQLPLFLHSRAAHRDFVDLMKAKFGDRLEKLEKGGVVHSFTGSVDEMRELADLGLYIGVNGCSFKTEENCAVVKEIDLSRIMLETDGPWCEVRPTHAGWQYLIDREVAGGALDPETKPQKGKKNQRKEPEAPNRFKVVKKEKWEEGAMVKGRNEPCSIERVAKIVAKIKGVPLEEVCESAWANTVKVFGLDP